MIEGMESRTYDSDETLISILEAIKEENHHTVTGIAGVLDISKSTVHSHLATLRKHGFITKEGKEYFIGYRFLNYGIHARNRLDFYHTAKEKVDMLAKTTGERIWLVVEDSGMAVHLHKAIGENAIKTPDPVGKLGRLYPIAAGKAILAFMEESRRESLLENLEFEQFTAHTPTDAESLRAELEEVRETGVAYNLEERLQGVNAIGVPIRRYDEGVYGAISLTGPTNRLTRGKLDGEYKNLLMGISNEIEIDLQYNE